MFTRFRREAPKPARMDGERIELPDPVSDSNTSIEEALHKRRSLREYQRGELTLAEVGQLLCAAQGVTGPQGQRTTPSAGALYPLEVYLVSWEVAELAVGIYHYLPSEHALLCRAKGDIQEELSSASLGQESLRQAAVIIVLTAVYERTAHKYGERAERYVHMEVGSVAQNVALQAESLGLGTVIIGAFRDDEVKKVLALPVDEHPLCLLPVGRK
ncbi:MAG TPA: SagB/ThcOx family dehydrogenase [Anaerolineales bacterium]|nr:SagB/ThcOx family dehydrogenase [Anaerolineales bacterium]